MFNIRLHYVVLSLILLYALIVRAVLLDVPFHTTAEGIGSFYAIHARNYSRIPWSEHYGVPVQNSCYHESLPLRFYSHHPPLMPLTIAASYKLFGPGEWQTRLPAALCTIGSILLLYHLLKKQNPAAALYAAAIYASLPIVLYYGAQPEFLNPQFVFLTLLTTTAFFRFNLAPSLKSLALLCLSFALAAATDWPAFYLAPLGVVFFVASHKAKHWPLLLAFIIFSAVIFILLYAHITLTATHDWSWMLHELRARTVGHDNQLTAAAWLSKAWYYNSTHHTIPILLLSAIWLISLFKISNLKSQISIFLLLFPLLHLLIGLRGSFDHAWWWWPLTPFLAISSALALNQLLDRVPPRFKTPAHAITILLLILFSAINVKKVLPEFFDPNITADGRSYDSKMLARAVRFAAPNPHDSVIIVSGEVHPSLWYYADRPIKMHVWSVSQLNERFNDNTIDLTFGWTQQCPTRPTAIILPKLYSNAAKDLHQHLRASYKQIHPPEPLSQLYEIFDLTP